MTDPGPGPERAVSTRTVRADDAGPLLAIYTPIVTDTAISFELEPPTEPEFADRIARISGSDPWLVAEVDGRVAGYAYATAFRARAAYGATRESTVYVDPGHQGRGVARALMTALLDRLEADGVHLVVAGIVLPNEPSVALHERLGFRPVGVFTDVGRKFGRWHDVGFWQRRLG